MAVLGYLEKLKRGLGLAFGADFLHNFCIKFWIKCSVFNTLSIDKVSISHLISFSRYQTQFVIKSLFRQMMTSQTLRLFLKGGEGEFTKVWISQEQKELFRWNKKHFS